MAVATDTLPVTAPGIILGIGLGGFFDGIFLHQIFQLHHMFSSVITVDTVPGLRMNTLGDGVFTHRHMALSPDRSRIALFPCDPWAPASLGVSRALGLDVERLGLVQPSRGFDRS